VTGRRLAAGRIERWLEPALASPATYAAAVARAGGLGVVVAPEEIEAAPASMLLEHFDGLVLTGGIDIDPARYGQVPAPETYGCDPLVDGFEMTLLEAALADGVPTLAICRGLQVLNVVRGGTLHQHITDEPNQLCHGIPNGGGGSPVEVRIEDGTRLAEAVGARSAISFCHHHQAVDRLGTGLTVVARADDGVIEAVEPVDIGGWVIAVQWHPEDTAADDPAQQRLFDALVERASARYGSAPPRGRTGSEPPGFRERGRHTGRQIM